LYETIQLSYLSPLIRQIISPRHLSELCITVTHVPGRHKLHSASQGLLYFPRYNMTNYSRRAFSYTGPQAWNLLPENMWKSTSIAIFKCSLNTFLFKQIMHLAC